MRAELGIADTDTVVVYVGSFKPWHQLNFLVEASKRLTQERMKFLLVGYGAGSQEHEVWSTLKRTAPKGKFIFTGSITNKDVPRYLAAADIGVQPGAPDYCAPLKLVEYLAAGLAILAPATPGIEEIFTDRVNAVLFKPGNTEEFIERLTFLIHHPEQRARVAERARQDAEPYTWTANARKFLEVIDLHRRTPTPSTPEKLKQDQPGITA